MTRRPPLRRRLAALLLAGAALGLAPPPAAAAAPAPSAPALAAPPAAQGKKKPKPKPGKAGPKKPKPGAGAKKGPQKPGAQPPGRAGAAGGPQAGPAAGRGAAAAQAAGPTPHRDPLPPPVDQARGTYPTVHPQALDVAAELGFAHQDTAGGCDQTCLSVAGAHEGGFAAIFQDERKGNLGLFLARLGPDGERLGEQLPVSDQVGTARELFPAVAPAAGGAGALAWMKMAGRSQAQLRFFGLDREAWSEMLPLGSQPYQARVATEMRRGVPSREARGPEAVAEQAAPTLPDVVRAPDGRVVVAWQEGPRVLLATYRDGAPERPPVAINPGAAEATRGPRVAVDGEGRVLAAWETAEGLAAYLAWDRSLEVGEGRELRPALLPAGPGALRAVEPDPRGGFWLLVALEDRVVLRHLDVEGARDRDDVPVYGGDARAVDVATWAYGLCVLVERGDGRRTREIELRLFLPDGRPGAVAPLVIPASPRAKGAFVAGEGPAPERLLVVWNDDRERNGDVFHAFLTRGPEGPALGPEARWNDDAASSYQVAPSLASAGARAVIAWGDERASAGQIHYRLIGAGDAPAAAPRWLGDERPIGAADPDRDLLMRRAATAMNADGRFLVAWVESYGPRNPFRLRAQVFHADGAPVVPPFDVDPGFEAHASSAPAAVALAGDQGYVMAWVREGVGPVARRITLTGELPGEAWRVGDRAIPTAANVELALLTPHRLVCVWDEASEAGPRVLTGHLLGADAQLQGAELRFAWSGAGGDLDPEVCATGDGGFLMAWTARDGPPRDVLARFHDVDGNPTGLPLGISTIQNEQDFSDVARLADGSFVVVWEDDLSGVDHAVARRIAPDRETLGPIVMVDPGTGKHVEVRHAPRVAPLGDGFVSAWNDHGASRGVDVVARAIGPAFDAGLPPEPPDEAR